MIWTRSPMVGTTRALAHSALNTKSCSQAGVLALLPLFCAVSACGAAVDPPGDAGYDSGRGWGGPPDGGLPGGADGITLDVGAATDGEADAGAAVTDVGGGKDAGAAVDAGPGDTTGPVDGGTADGGGTDLGDQTICGDGACEQPENEFNCAVDCGPPVDPCGDGTCAGSETPSSCAIDCKAQAKAIWDCLKGKCPADVKACLLAPACAVGVNSAMNCFASCNFANPCANQNACVGSFASSPAGGKLAQCGLTECYGGAGAAICGDGICQPGEDKFNCIADCVANPTCGDGKCEAPESAQSCSTDCAVAAKCGDELCNGGESAASCPIDCNSGAKAAWICLADNCAAAKEACQTDDTCVAILNEVGICLCGCGGAKKCEEDCVLKHLSNSKFVAVGTCGLQNCPAGGC